MALEGDKDNNCCDYINKAIGRIAYAQANAFNSFKSEYVKNYYELLRLVGTGFNSVNNGSSGTGFPPTSGSYLEINNNNFILADPLLTVTAANANFAEAILFALTNFIPALNTAVVTLANIGFRALSCLCSSKSKCCESAANTIGDATVTAINELAVGISALTLANDPYLSQVVGVVYKIPGTSGGSGASANAASFILNSTIQSSGIPTPNPPIVLTPPASTAFPTLVTNTTNNLRTALDGVVSYTCGSFDKKCKTC